MLFFKPQMKGFSLPAPAIFCAFLISNAVAAQPRDWNTVETDSGKPLSEEQAAYDARHYDLDLSIDPETQRIAGEVAVKAVVIAPLKTFVLDLDKRMQVSAVALLSDDGRAPLKYKHKNGKLSIKLPGKADAGTILKIAVAYEGAPRIAPNPPWEGGFTWEKTASGEDWIGVSCQLDGADMWWPVKDHPSDEPEEGVSLHFTAPSKLAVVTNGRHESSVDNADGTTTHNWRVTTTIDTYNVTFNAGPFEPVKIDYTSVSGRPLPITYWALPEDVEAARAQVPELAGHLRFLEETFGPYPFQGDKYALVEAPYLAMEHQTNITHGKGSLVAMRMGFHYIPLHELTHEWWGNLVSNKDYSDFWLQEGFNGYTEALYAEKTLGAAAYHEYMARFVRAGVQEDKAVAARGDATVRQALADYDPYLKGAMLLHTLRYLVGDEAMFEILRRQAYPEPDYSADELLSCSQCRLATSAEFIALAERISGRDLGWFFELYLYRPELPELMTEDRGDSLSISWRLPEGVEFPMPVEVVKNGETMRIEMTDGEAILSKGPGDTIELDPTFWILRKTKPDPDKFGRLGVEDYAGLKSAE